MNVLIRMIQNTDCDDDHEGEGADKEDREIEIGN